MMDWVCSYCRHICVIAGVESCRCIYRHHENFYYSRVSVEFEDENSRILVDYFYDDVDVMDSPPEGDDALSLADTDTGDPNEEIEDEFTLMFAERA